MTRYSLFRERFRRALWALLAAALMMPILAACGEEETGAQPNETPAATATFTAPPTLAPTATATATLAPTATAESLPRPPADNVPAGHSNEIAPPLAEMSGASGVQQAALGTYCWQEGDQGLCADYIGLPVPETALAVVAGEALTIAVPGITQLVNIQLGAYRFADVEFVENVPPIINLPAESLAVQYVDDGRSITLTADLPPGEYIVSLFVGFPAEASGVATPNASANTVRGDASYGFHIVVS